MSLLSPRKSGPGAGERYTDNATDGGTDEDSERFYAIERAAAASRKSTIAYVLDRAYCHKVIARFEHGRTVSAGDRARAYAKELNDAYR